MALPKVIDIQRFDVDSKECPRPLRLILRHDIRDLLKRRNETRSCVASNHGLDALLDKWWLHHKNIIRAASIRPEWDWKTLSLIFDENVSRPVNFFEARKDFLTLLARPFYLERSLWSAWSYSPNCVAPFSPSNTKYLGKFHQVLYSLYIDVFNIVILEDTPVSPEDEYDDSDARLSAEFVNSVKEFISQHTQADQRGAFCTAGIGSLVSDNPDEFIPFNKLPKAIFNKISSVRKNDDEYEALIRSLENYFDTHREDFIADLYKSIGAHQMAGTPDPKSRHPDPSEHGSFRRRAARRR